MCRSSKNRQRTEYFSGPVKFKRLPWSLVRITSHQFKSITKCLSTFGCLFLISGSGNNLNMYCHAVKMGASKQKTIQETVFYELATFKLVLDFVLTLNQLPCDISGFGLKPAGAKKGKLNIYNGVAGFCCYITILTNFRSHDVPCF